MSDSEFEPTDAEVAWLYGEQNLVADSWAPLNLAEIEDAPPVQPTLGGLGFVYPGKRHMFSGPPESAKTLAAYVVGIAVIRQGHKIALIDFEMGPWDARTRLRELGATSEEMANVLYVEPETWPQPADITALIEAKPELVIVDAAVGAFSLDGLDDNSRKDVERWANAWIQPFRKASIATIILDHVTKNAEARGNYAIGSERKQGHVDTHIGFSVIKPIRRGETGKYRVTTQKDRGGHLKRGHLCDFVLSSDPATHAISWAFEAVQPVDDEHPFRPTGIMEKVSRFLERQTTPSSQRAVEREKLGKAQYVRDAIQILADEGYVHRLETPGGLQLTSVRAYRQDDDEVRPEVRPGASLDPGEAGASLRPTPYRGDADAASPWDASRGASQSVLDDDIPF